MPGSTTNVAALDSATTAIDTKQHDAPSHPNDDVGTDAAALKTHASTSAPATPCLDILALDDTKHALALPTNPTNPAHPVHPTRGRPRMHGAGRQANRALRSPVTYAHKLAVIDYYDAHERDINATMREFYAQLAPTAVASRKRQIYKWVKERAAIEEMCFKQATAGHSRRREKGTATTLGVAGEQELVHWIQTQQQQCGGGEIAAASVRVRAMEIAARHGVPAGAFQATWSWQQGFFKRHQDAIQRF